MKSRTKQILTIFILLIFLGSGFTGIILSIIPGGGYSTNWRAALVITIHDKQTEIPARIGFVDDTSPKGFFTLDNSSVFFKGTSEDLPLGDFFKAWGKTFNSTCIFEYCNNGNHSMEMYICSDCLRTYTGDYKQNSDYEFYIVKNDDVIRIDYR